MNSNNSTGFVVFYGSSEKLVQNPNHNSYTQMKCPQIFTNQNMWVHINSTLILGM